MAGQGLEKKLKRDLFLYCHIHPDYYEDLANYQTRDFRLIEMLHAFLGHDQWTFEQRAIWYQATPKESHSLPHSGFKIHISGTSGNALRILNACLPILRDGGITFKVLVDLNMLDFTNSKNYPRFQSGKFITVYPFEHNFTAVCNALSNAVAGFHGPYILSDRRHPNGSVVHYRYGAFATVFDVDVHGEATPKLRMEDGRELIDDRSTFTLPAGITDPFETLEDVVDTEFLLAGKYRVLDALSFSNAGGIYKAEDVRNGCTVCIKEARPHVHFGPTSDAVKVLRHEAAILERLQFSQHVPRFIEYFTEWEHSYLVEEFITGEHLSSYRAAVDFGLLLNREPTNISITTFSNHLKAVAHDLICALNEIHSHGIYLGDIAPDNIIVERDSGRLVFIDFDSAHATHLTSEYVIDWQAVTLGYGNVQTLRRATRITDLEALSAVLFSIIFPTQPLFAFESSAWHSVLSSVCTDFALPASIYSLISALKEGRATEALQFTKPDGIPQTSCNLPIIAIRNPQEVASALTHELNDIVRYIQHAAEPRRIDRLWPSDYRVFSSNPLSFAYGACGILSFLHEQGQTTKFDDHLEWLHQRLDSSQHHYPPGLFIGKAGIAHVLMQLGFHDRAQTLLSEAQADPMLETSPDLFYGLAGVGIELLNQWYTYHDRSALSNALRCADILVCQSTPRGSGVAWNNTDGHVYHGLLHGGSGIGFFLLLAGLASSSNDLIELAHRAFESVIAEATTIGQMLTWERIPGGTLLTPYLRYGNAGIGSVLIRAYALTKQPAYLSAARAAASYAQVKYAVFPGQLEGLAGIGELLLDLFAFTGESGYRSDAQRIAEGMMLFSIKRPLGSVYPGEELMRLSLDYGTGSAGIGAFYSRFLHPRARHFFDISPELQMVWRSPPRLGCDNTI